MKKHFPIMLLLSSSVIATLALTGCDKKEDMKVVEDKISTEILNDKGKSIASEDVALQPANLSPNAENAKALKANDMKLWAFLPEVVAEIDGKKITKQEVIKNFAAQMPNGQLPPMITPEMLKGLAPRIVKGYVDNFLMNASAKKAGFVPSKESVVATIKAQMANLKPEEKKMLEAQIMQQSGKSLDAFIDEMASNKATQDSLATQKFIESKIGKITISDAEAKAYYEKNKQNFKTASDPADAIRASHILIMAKKDAPKADIAAAKKKAEAILTQIKADEKSFEDLAQKHSECPSGKQNKGSLGAFKKGQMVKEFEDAAFSLKDGEISGIVQTDFGFHIIRRDKKAAATVISFDKAKTNIKSMLQQERSTQAIQTLINNLEKENNVKFFVKEPAMPQMMPVAPKK